MYDRGICKKERSHALPGSPGSAQDCHLPAPCNMQNRLKQFFCTYRCSLFLCLVLTELSQGSKSVCKDLHACTCHFFGFPEGKGVVCLPRWIEPSEPSVFTFSITLLRVNRVPTKQTFTSPSWINFSLQVLIETQMKYFFSTNDVLSSRTCLQSLFLGDLTKQAAGF